MIIITGASHGIGKLLFDWFKSKGENVFGTCYSSTSSDDNIERVDVSVYDDVFNWSEALIKKGASELILINCAGISFKSFFHKSDIAEWKRVIDVNLMGVYHSTRCFIPIMREQGYGRIINFSSVVSKIGVLGTSAYASSKSALSGFAKAVATENGRKGVTINNINLGYADIGMGEREIPVEMRKELLERIPVGRFCYPEEIISTVDFLIHNAYVNGASIDVNGGLS